MREAPHARDRGAQLVVAGVAVWTLCYFLVFEKLGFVIATAIYLVALTSYFNPGKPIPNVLTSVLFIPWDDGTGSIRPVLRLGWTLNYEVFFYLLFGVALLFMNTATVTAFPTTRFPRTRSGAVPLAMRMA